MISALSTMLTCHWSARRIQRYLDADPSAPLEPGEVHRLEEHLATCERCSAAAEEHRGLRRALARWSQRGADPAAVARLRLAAERLLAEDAG
jgi:anti-sigma factor RsiW